jgi:type I restriction enzyme M protein
MSPNQIISKVWSFFNTLRDDGVSYGDYLEQLTYLLFLKMADEFSKALYNKTLPIFRPGKLIKEFMKKDLY